MLDTLQRGLPSLLQLRCDQAVVGVACGIATFGQRCIVLRLPQLQLGDAPPVLSSSLSMRSASCAASIAIGATARSISAAIAASMRCRRS